MTGPLPAIGMGLTACVILACGMMLLACGVEGYSIVAVWR